MCRGFGYVERRCWEYTGVIDLGWRELLGTLIGVKSGYNWSDDDRQRNPLLGKTHHRFTKVKRRSADVEIAPNNTCIKDRHQELSEI